MIHLHRALVAVILVVAGAADTACTAAPPLERQLLAHAPEVLQHLRGQGCRNVGVLKFLVLRDGRFSDNAGTLNQTLARQMEIALLLKNDPRRPLGIVANASAVAARTPGANHRTAAGRRALLAARYPLAWKSAETAEAVPVDGFVTGVVTASADLRTLTVCLLVFTRKDDRLAQVGSDFEAVNRAEQLIEMGESFRLRGLFDGGSPEVIEQKKQAQAVREAARARQEPRVHPLMDREAPVALEVRYDGQAVPIRFRDGRASVPEPEENQHVVLVLRRDRTKERYGVVLKVNGENTIGRERRPDVQCRKWLLDPGDGPLSIRGYQLDTRSAQEFRVLSRPESGPREVNYGVDVGTITLTVFREQRGNGPPPDLTDDGAEAAAVSRAQLPERKADNYHALKAQLLADANRGLIGEGRRIANATRAVRFRPDPTPLMSVTIIYYSPKKKE